MAITAIHLVIHGRVQGVGYRAWTSSVAREHGLNGWVRNRREGTVEALMHGEAEIVELVVEQCLKGPPAAKVTRIESEEWQGDVPEGFATQTTV